MALEQKKITGGGSVHVKLNCIFKLDKFLAFIFEELAHYGVKENNFSGSLTIIYPVLRHFVNRNDGEIVLQELYHPDNELAKLIVLI